MRSTKESTITFRRLKTVDERPICIIPARGASKRVSDKNIAEVGGKPLIAYTIETALSSRLFSRTIVSSEDRNILGVSEQYGAEAHKRPAELSEDRALLIDVIKETAASLNIGNETAIGIMLATCPLRSAEDVKRAWRIFLDNNREFSVVSVTPYERPIQLAHRISAENRLAPIFYEEYSRTTRSQEHFKTYWYNGAIIFNTAGRLKGQKNLLGQNPVPYIMPFERSVDIDHEFQMEFVRFHLENSRGKS